MAKNNILAGNNCRANIEYGHYDAGYGLFLKNEGKLNFRTETIRQSGLMVRGEVQKMLMVETPGFPVIFFAKNNAPWQLVSAGRNPQ